MIVRFLKNPHSAHADHLTCIRSEGPAWEIELPRAGVLPLLAVRYVVESNLGWTNGWFGTVAQASEPDETTHESRLSHILAQLIQTEQWNGASPPDAFRQKLTAASADAKLSPPKITDEQLAALRTDLRSFGAAWRPLNVGQMHEVRWDQA